MRFKINVDLDKLQLNKVALETATILNKVLGKNHQWHDLSNKPYTCSMISGGEIVGDELLFNKKQGFFYINTEDDEVINAITSNLSLKFDIEDVKLFDDYNLFSVKNVIYNKSSERLFITKENKKDFISYVKNKYLVDIEILKIENKRVSYKNKSNLPVSNLLIKCKGSENVKNLLESGIGGSCSIGFGHVEPIIVK